MSYQYKNHKGYKAIILKTLDMNPGKWFKSYELQQINTPYGWIGSRGSRDCRDLAATGKILVSHDRSEYAEYKSIDEYRPPRVLPHYAVEFIGNKSLFQPTT